MSLKLKLKKIMLKIISLSPVLTKKYFNDYGNNNKIIIVKNGVEKSARPQDLPDNFVIFKGNNNVLKIHYPTNLKKSAFYFDKNDAYIEIKEKQNINVEIHMQEENRKVLIGSGCYCLGMKIFASSNDIVIGKNGMFSDDIIILGDNHSVIDFETREILNNTKGNKKTIIGDHVLIGGKVVFTKNANIPNDSIVAFASVVTKAFDEEHSVIAGNPAKVVKRGVSWNSMAPNKYDKEIAKDMLV